MLKEPELAASLRFFFSFVSSNMDRLLVYLFSCSLFLATSPPEMPNAACDYSGGICTMKQSCGEQQSRSCPFDKNGKKGCGGKKSGCPLPACCLNGPCCCLCIVPERPVLHMAPVLAEEKRVKPHYNPNFHPQEVSLSIWKPPAFSV